jgi:hypothetical protein
MIFLDDPPPGTRDRWKEGAAMCAAWGITCSGASVWRLYRSYAIEWRAHLALEIGLENGESLEALGQKAARMIALRICELLANPQTPPAVLLGLARVELRQKVLDLARQKHQDHERDETERALSALDVLVSRDRLAQFALTQLKDALQSSPSHHPPFGLSLPALDPKPK